MSLSVHINSTRSHFIDHIKRVHHFPIDNFSRPVEQILSPSFEDEKEIRFDLNKERQVEELRSIEIILSLPSLSISKEFFKEIKQISPNSFKTAKTANLHPQKLRHKPKKKKGKESSVSFLESSSSSSSESETEEKKEDEEDEIEEQEDSFIQVYYSDHPLIDFLPFARFYWSKEDQLPEDLYLPLQEMTNLSHDSFFQSWSTLDQENSNQNQKKKLKKNTSKTLIWKMQIPSLQYAHASSNQEFSLALFPDAFLEFKKQNFLEMVCIHTSHKKVEQMIQKIGLNAFLEKYLVVGQAPFSKQKEKDFVNVKLRLTGFSLKDLDDADEKWNLYLQETLQFEYFRPTYFWIPAIPVKKISRQRVRFTVEISHLSLGVCFFARSKEKSKMHQKWSLCSEVFDSFSIQTKRKPQAPRQWICDPRPIELVTHSFDNGRFFFQSFENFELNGALVPWTWKNPNHTQTIRRSGIDFKEKELCIEFELSSVVDLSKLDIFVYSFSLCVKHAKWNESNHEIETKIAF